MIDYGSGNIQAIRNIYKRLNIPTSVVVSPKDLSNVSGIILPGVGAFDEAMSKLRSSGLYSSLNESVLEKKIPIMGICVGMQIMAESSEEGTMPGLGWVPGQVKRFDPNLINAVPKLPHMGWNEIETIPHQIFDKIDYKFGFYFLHSYYFEATSRESVIAQAYYGTKFDCAVMSNNIYGFQFHPEKSHHNGIQLFKNFAEIVQC